MEYKHSTMRGRGRARIGYRLKRAVFYANFFLLPLIFYLSGASTKAVELNIPLKNFYAYDHFSEYFWCLPLFLILFPAIFQFTRLNDDPGGKDRVKPFLYTWATVFLIWPVIGYFGFLLTETVTDVPGSPSLDWVVKATFPHLRTFFTGGFIWFQAAASVTLRLASHDALYAVPLWAALLSLPFFSAWVARRSEQWSKAEKPRAHACLIEEPMVLVRKDEREVCWVSASEWLKRVRVEKPQPYGVFAASGSEEAARLANGGGFVAVHVEGNEFLAIPAKFARKLLRPGAPHTEEEKATYYFLRKNLTSWGNLYELVNAGLRQSIEKQLEVVERRGRRIRMETEKKRMERRKRVEERRMEEEERARKQREINWKRLTSLELFKDVVGLRGAKEAIVEDFLEPLFFPEKCGGVEARGGMLLYGPPGTGKTEFVRVVSKVLNIPLIEVKPSDIESKFYGESEERVAKLFERARKSEPCIIFFDEADGLFARRADWESSHRFTLMAQFLREMDGLDSQRSSIYVIACTNKPWAIEPAVLRHCRFGRMVYVPPPSAEERIKLFKRHLRGVKTEQVDYGQLAELTECEAGYNSGADIKEVCKQVARMAARAGTAVTMETLEEAIDTTNPSILPITVTYFKNFQEKWLPKRGKRGATWKEGRYIS